MKPADMIHIYIYIFVLLLFVSVPSIFFNYKCYENICISISKYKKIWKLVKKYMWWTTPLKYNCDFCLLQWQWGRGFPVCPEGLWGLQWILSWGNWDCSKRKKHVNKYIILSMLLNFCVYNILNMFLAWFFCAICTCFRHQIKIFLKCYMWMYFLGFKYMEGKIYF